MSILVTGGAGYIGSHVALELLADGFDVIILDNFSTGHRETVVALKGLRDSGGLPGKLDFVYGDTGDRELLSSLMGSGKVSSVVHLAAFSQVGESMQKPGKYFDNNVARAINVLDCMAEYGVNNIVFSSTAAVYGEPEEIPIRESNKVKPTNVYGASKLMVEELLRWYERIYGIRHVALRYFNAAGADSSAMIGEWHEPETHLIPLVIQRVMGLRDKLVVFGDDYDTEDGSCIRDYIHVSDLARAHVLALEALSGGMASRTYNLGNGSGYSVKEVIQVVSEVVSSTVPYEIGERRTGDPAVLLASSEKIRDELGWKPRLPDLADIVLSAWKWHSKKR
ncbi:MAG: UDP-glucose 4-epimerase GalE [Syntrophomonas sp.]|nr:UDP-glucose 4-epimerase GalE [Syntrophomonas sp.]